MISVFLWAIFLIDETLAAPIFRRMVDMTYTFDETTQHWPGNKAFKMDIILNGTFDTNIWWLPVCSYFLVFLENKTKSLKYLKKEKMYLFLSVCVLGMAVHLNGAPLETRTVDLTHLFDENVFQYPPRVPIDITLLTNGTQERGFWLMSEKLSTPLHAGTHMDAPSHFTPGAKNVDDLPVEHLIAPAAVIDITAKATLDPDAGVTIDDLQNWEYTTGQSLDGKIVLMKSGYGRLYGDKTAYYGTPGDDPTQFHFPGIEPEAAEWLVNNRNPYGVGVDTLSLDKGSSLNLRSHTILLGSGIFGIENLANLEEIPISGATLHVLPLKVDTSGAPTRVLATFPQTISSFQVR